MPSRGSPQCSGDERPARCDSAGSIPRSVEERLSPGLTRRWQLGAVHYTARTVHQRVLIADTTHGVTLFCDDERQSAEATERVYHEALVLPAALLAARLSTGSSSSARVRASPRSSVVAAGAHLVDHVDIDRECVRACARHLPYGYTPAELDAAELQLPRSTCTTRTGPPSWRAAHTATTWWSSISPMNASTSRKHP